MSRMIKYCEIIDLSRRFQHPDTLLLRSFRVNQASRDHQVLKASRGSQVSQVSMALLAPKVHQVTEESWETMYVTQDLTFISSKGTSVRVCGMFVPG